MLARDLARALSPVTLARECGIEPDPWQATLLDANPRRSLLLCSRQSGKSTVAAFLVIQTALFVPAAQIVVVSPTQRQSNELFRTIVGFLGRLPARRAPPPKANRELSYRTVRVFFRYPAPKRPSAELPGWTS